MSRADGSRLPWPDQWRRTGRTTAALVVAGLAAVVVVAIALVVTQGLGDPVVLVGLAGVPVILLLLVLVVRTRLQARTAGAVRAASADEAPAGVTFPYRRDVGALRVLLTGYLALLGAVLLVGGLVLAGRGTEGWLPATVIGIALLVASVPRLVAVARGRLRTGAVVLTPDGVVHRSWSFDLTARWADVVGVSPGGDRQPHILVTTATRSEVGGVAPAGAGLTVRTRTWRQPEARLAPHVAIAADDLAADPALLLAALQFYLRHPELRSELATDEGLARVRRGDLLG